MEESEPQWMRELRERRRSQSGGRRPTPDMLLQQQSPHQHHHHASHVHGRDVGAIPDQQEDLTYGPGIVKKLKSRYISLTLRDAPPKPRPALLPLRRAASLEHGLDDEPQQPVRKFTPKAPAERPARYRPATRTPENIKRARSVDAVVRCDSRSDDEPQQLLSPPTPHTPPTPPPAPSPERTLRPKRPSPLLKDAERPPPDLVKTTLKIFETNPVRRTKGPAYTGQVADKVKSYTVQQQNKPKITDRKKPAIPPRSPLISPTMTQVSTQTTPSLISRPPPSPKKLILQNDRDSRDRSISPVYVNKHPVILSSPVRTDAPPLKHVVPFELKSPELSPTYPKNRRLMDHVQMDKNRNGDLLSPNENDVRTSTPDPETPSVPSATEISLISPNTPAYARKISESSSEDGSYDVQQLNGNDDPPTTKIISKSALENISKAGTTTQYSFGGVNGLNGDAKKSHLPTTKPWPANRNKLPLSSSDDEVFDDAVPVFAKNPCIKDPKESLESRAEKLTPLAPLLIPNYTMSITSEIVPLKKVDYIKSTLSPPKNKLINSETDPSESPALILQESPYNNGNSSLTSREIEKNLINKTKSLEQPVKKIVVSVIDSETKVTPKPSEPPKKSAHLDNSVLVPVLDIVKPNATALIGSEAVASASGVVANGVSSVKSSPKKPHWQQQQQQQTSMVFNFSNRKEVPDYIENDGLILRSSTRDRHKPSDGISLSGLGGESTDNVEEDVDGDWAVWAAGPPSPCDVAFENDNVVINGRSNIAKPNSRSKQLKIQFNDSLTRTFEYPSEASLIEESTTSAISPLALGGSLSTYTPSKVLLQAETYQLGVTKSSSPTTNGSKSDSEDTSASTNGDTLNSTNSPHSSYKQSSQDSHEDDYLKPLRDGDSHNWSHETHRGAGDLLF